MVFLMVILWMWAGIDKWEEKVGGPTELAIEKLILLIRETIYAGDAMPMGIFQSVLQHRADALSILGPPLGLELEGPKCASWLANFHSKHT